MSARLVLALAGLVALAGCAAEGRGTSGSRTPAPVPTPPSASPSASDGDDARADVGRVRLVSDAGAVVVRLRDNPATRDLVSMLPLRLEVEDHAGTERIAYLPRELETRGSPGGTPAVGELMYYAPWGNLVLYVAEGGVPSDGLVSLGTVEQGGDRMADLAGAVRLERTS